MERNHSTSHHQQQNHKIIVPEQSVQKLKSQQRYTQDNDLQFFEKESIDRQKRYLIYKLKNQTQKLHDDCDKFFRTSNKKLKTQPSQEDNNLWDQFSNYYRQGSVHKQQHSKIDEHKIEDFTQVKKKVHSKRIYKEQYQNRQSRQEHRKLIEEIKHLKQENLQLKRIITQINMLSDVYIDTIKEIEIDLNCYKVSLEVRDKTIESLKNMNIEKIQIKTFVQKQLELHKQIQRLQLELHKTNQKLNEVIQDYQNCFKDKEKYEEIIFEQQCEKKIYKRYFIDFINLYQKMEDDKQRVFSKLINLRKDNIK